MHLCIFCTRKMSQLVSQILRLVSFTKHPANNGKIFICQFRPKLPQVAVHCRKYISCTVLYNLLWTCKDFCTKSFRSLSCFSERYFFFTANFYTILEYMLLTMYLGNMRLSHHGSTISCMKTNEYRFFSAAQLIKTLGYHQDVRCSINILANFFILF